MNRTGKDAKRPRDLEKTGKMTGSSTEKTEKPADADVSRTGASEGSLKRQDTKVVFAKFSRERSLPFQIATLICEKEGVRTVYKEALNFSAREHLAKMPERAKMLAELYKVPYLYTAPCERAGESRVSFPYYEGESLDQVITREVEAGDFESVKRNVERLWEILNSQAGLADFAPSKEFAEIFGSPALPEGLKAAPLSNLDMLFSNLLLCGAETQREHLVLIDYEWVFDFPVPVTFLFARSLILHGMLQTLPREQLAELYSVGGITPEEVPLYYQMEVKFQKYVAGEEELNVLARLYPKMKTCSFFLDYWNTQHVYYAVRVRGVLKDHPERTDELYFSLRFQGEVKETVEIADTSRYEAFLLEPADTEAILRMYYLQGETDAGKEDIALSFHNADLVLNLVDYYFKEPPLMRIENRGYQKLSFGYLICHRNDPLIAHEIDLRTELRRYTEKPYRKAVRRLKRMIKGQ